MNPPIDRPPWESVWEPEPLWRRVLLRLAGRRRGWRYNRKMKRWEKSAS